MAPVSPLLDGALSFGPHAIGGDTDTVMQTAISKESSDFTNLHNWAPSYRQIVDLGNLVKSQASFGPGQSGQLGSPYYGDQIPMFLRGELASTGWSAHDANLEDGERHELILENTPGRLSM